MSVSRWKGQSLLFHRNIAGPGSKATERHGIFPAYARIVCDIASAGGALAGLAKKSWRDAKLSRIPLEKVRQLRQRINESFDQLETLLEDSEAAKDTAIPPRKRKQSERNFRKHGNLAILALGLMEESAELAQPIIQIAEGSKTLDQIKPEIDFESADVRIQLHLISEAASVCSETSTAAKWAIVRERFSPELFEIAPLEIANDTTGTAKKANAK